MSTTTEAPRAHEAFDTFVALQQANLDLLEVSAGTGPNGTVQAPNVEEMREFIGRAVATGSILDRQPERKAAKAAIDYWTTSLILAHPPSDTLPNGSSEALLQTLAPFDPSRDPKISTAVSPFKGLEPFETADKDRFFGRSDAKAELAKRVQSQPFVLLLGPSGSGKSSLVNAGLIPELERGALADTHRIVPVPQLGRRPLAAILAAIMPDESSEQCDEHEKAIVKSPGKLGELLRSASSKRTILIIDHTGEALSRSDIQPTLEILGKALASCIGVATLLICLRESQRKQFENIAGLGEYAKSAENCFVLPPPTAQELRSMIEGPAARVGLQFEEGVVDDLVKALVGSSDALALLQFTLDRLWTARERNTITRKVYRSLGAPRQAVRNAADKVYEILSVKDQKVAEHVFEKLVVPSDDRQFIRVRIILE